jgi:hypothetical protein
MADTTPILEAKLSEFQFQRKGVSDANCQQTWMEQWWPPAGHKHASGARE